MSESTTVICGHIYKNQDEEICSSCSKPTHEIDWVKQNQLMTEWKEANPNRQYQGWWSI